MTTGLPPASATTADAAHDRPRANVLTGRRWGHTSFLLLAAFALTLVAHRRTALEAVDLWHRSYTYAYAWLVLPALLFLLWQNRARLAAIAPKHSLSAWVPAMLFAGLWVIGDLANIAVVRQSALVASLGAIVLAGVGWPAFGRLAPYVALLFFCVPAADVLLEPLKSIAVNVVRVYAALVGIAFERDGLSMTIGANRYVIIDDCAGVEHAIAGAFIGLVLALQIYAHPIKAAAFAFVGGAAGIASNWIRILAIITYDYATGSELTLEQHRYFETPALLLAFGALLFLFSRLRPERTTAEDASDAIVGRPWLKVASVASATLPILLVSTLTHSSGLSAAGALEAPKRVLGWEREERHDGWRPRLLTPGVASLVTAFSADDGTGSTQVFVAEAKSRRDKLSGGALDLVGGREWLPVLEERMRACGHERCLEVTHVKLIRQKARDARHIYVAYAIGTDVVATPFAFRMKRALSTLLRRQEAPRVVAVAKDAEEGLSGEEVAALVSAFLSKSPGT